MGLSAKRLREQIERALCRAYLGSGDAQISGRSSQAAMTQQQLNCAHVGARFQQMHGKRVPQGMRCDRFGNRATPARLLARILDGWSADMGVGLIAREEPFLGSIHSPPLAQDLQQLWREHNIAVYSPFASSDADNHSFAIDIGDFQADSFRDAVRLRSRLLESCDA